MSDLNKLSKIVDESVFVDPGNDISNVQEAKARLYLYPNTIEEISEALRFCNKNRIPLIPSGNGTKLYMTSGPANAEVVLSTRNMNRLIDHETADLVSTAECGLTLKKYQLSLRKKRQFLPVESPFAESATLGGVISSNIPGPSSTRYGTCRELLLGIKAVRADGEIIKGGAKVVKNVAGYDVPKLMVGAFGTLGIIVEATFRLYPIQEYSETAVMVVNGYPDLELLFDIISATDATPASFEILDKKLTGRLFPKMDNCMAVLYKLESFEKAVLQQMQQLQSKIGGNVHDFFRLSGRSEKNLWKKLAEFPFDQKYKVTCKASLPVRNSFRLFKVLEEIHESMQVEIESVLRPERGTVIFSLNGNSDDTVYAANLLRSQAQALYGSLVFTSLSDDTKGKLDTSVYYGTELKVMKVLKNYFDPNDILNPRGLFTKDD